MILSIEAPWSSQARAAGRSFSWDGSMRGYDVAGVAQNEKLTRFGLRKQAGADARVGTGDEKGERMLSLAQVLEQFLLRAENVALELVNPFNELQHGDELRDRRERGA